MFSLNHYLTTVPTEKRSLAAISYLANLELLQKSYPQIADAIVQELEAQRSNLKLIASENYCSLLVQLAMGNLLTDKYSEGAVRRRFYAGCENVDTVEEEAIFYAKKIFGADHAYVQPHCGSDANLVALWSILVKRVQMPYLEKLGKKSLEELTFAEHEELRKEMLSQKMMGMSLAAGGHLTHGYRQNISSKLFTVVPYEVDPKTYLIDYESLQAKVKREKPLVLLVGYSAYSRLIDFAKMREIADSVGATLFVDMAHFSGLVAGKVMTGKYNPVPYAEILTTTTHKVLRGPRGGLVLCREEYKDIVDKGCPMVMGGPLPHVMAAKAIAFKEVAEPSYEKYAKQVVLNAKALAKTLMEEGVKVITDGTDNHLVLLDVAKSFGLTGRQAENALKEANINVNRNAIFQDSQGAWYTSGIRIGTPAVTTLGMKEEDMEELGKILVSVLKNTQPKENPKTKTPSKAQVIVDEKALNMARERVKELLSKHPLYPELVLQEDVCKV